MQFRYITIRIMQLLVPAGSFSLMKRKGRGLRDGGNREGEKEKVQFNSA